MYRDMDIGMKCIKYMLFVSNFMFVMVGFLLISIGTTISSIYSDFELFMEAHHLKPAQLIVAIGIIIFFVSLFGCIGAIRESTFLVNMFGLLLSILLILEISAAITAYVMRSDISEGVEDNMYDVMEDYETTYDAQLSWDFMQERLGCCGVHKPLDWKKMNLQNGTNTGFENSTFTVPSSCCKFIECGNNGVIFTYGCLDRLSSIISESALMIGVGATCVALVELLGVVFAFMLAKTIRRVKAEEEMRRQENRQKIYEQLALGNEEKVTPVLYTSQSTDA